MTFPGAGRAVLIGGSLGGGTGRTNDWSTYDATQDSAWQQWVDDTSTAISSSTDVTATPMNAHGLGGGEGVLVITDGSVNKVALFKADTDDATAGQFTIIGSHANTGTMRVFGTTILLTGTDDNGSIVTYTHAAGALTGGTKISGLHTFYHHDSTYTPAHEGVGVTLSVDFPWTHDYNMSGGAGYTDGSGYWSANRKTNWLQVWAMNPEPNPSSPSTDRNWQYFTPYRVNNVNDLVSSPSSALTGFNGHTIGHTEASNGANYNVNNNRMQTQKSGGGALFGGTLKVEPKDNFVIPFTRTVGDPQFTTDPAGIHNIVFFFASQNTGYSDTADVTADSRRFQFGWSHNRFVHLEDQDQNSTVPDWYDGDSTERTFTTFSTGYNDGRRQAEAKVREKMKAIQMGDAYIGLYGDCSSVSDIGNLYLTTCGVTTENTNNNRTEFEGIMADSITSGVGQTLQLSDPATQAQANDDVAVSRVNGSDSSSTAYDPASTALFALDDDYFAVAWTTSSNVYVSVFEVTAQTSTHPVITMVKDTVNLGSIPASSGTKRVSGMRINKGVGVITCGNYYRIIKTNTI
jgi:hypothetical protein